MLIVQLLLRKMLSVVSKILSTLFILLFLKEPAPIPNVLGLGGIFLIEIIVVNC